MRLLNSGSDKWLCNIRSYCSQKWAEGISALSDDTEWVSRSLLRKWKHFAQCISCGIAHTGPPIRDSLVVEFRGSHHYRLAFGLLKKKKGRYEARSRYVDQGGVYVVFISEIDFLTALAEGQISTSSQRLMVKNPIAVRKSRPIAEAIKIMADKHLLNLPVEENGQVTYSVRV